ncbi:MAG TPA: hypothetical protein VGI10_12180 [Polyangiaceae bacterium]|jgi:hypothetical protein
MQSPVKLSGVWIGKILVPCDNLETLDVLVARYAGLGPASPGAQGETPAKPGSNGKAQQPPAGASDNDMRLLNALVQAGDRGVPSGTLASLLGGVRGRAVPPAARAFCLRVGLGASDCVATDRVNGKRSWKLTTGGLGAARLKLTGGAAG